MKYETRSYVHEADLIRSMSKYQKARLSLRLLESLADDLTGTPDGESTIRRGAHDLRATINEIWQELT